MVKTGEAALAMIPIENSVAGRVADIHHLLPESGLYIVGEHFERVRHQLLALPGVKLDELKTVHSHTMALGQCRKVIRLLGLRPVPEADTAGAARHLREWGDRSRGGDRLGARRRGLRLEDRQGRHRGRAAQHHAVRGVGARSRARPKVKDGPVVTTFIFRVRNVPAALYKALGGFATNGVNMTKLESYQLEGSFNATMFYADIEGHPDERSVALAMEELHFFSSEVKLLGTYPASRFRAELKALEG